MTVQIRKRRELFPHQVDVLQRIQKQPRIALFLQMRLGKTLLAIRWAMQFPAPRLVVAPLSVLLSWQKELHLEGHKSYLLSGPKISRFHDFQKSRAPWALINYEGLYPDRNGIAQRVMTYTWSTVILDESVRIRNPKAQITKLCSRHFSSVPNRAILSGLPNPEGPLDFFEQFRFLGISFFGCKNYWEFRTRYFVPDTHGYTWNPTLKLLKKVKSVVSKKAVVVSRKSVGLANRVLTEDRHVELPQKMRTVYDNVERTFALGSEQTAWRLTMYTWLLRLAGGRAINKEKQKFYHDAKLDELAELLQGNLRNEKTLIWFVFRREGRAILKKVRCLGRCAAIIHGDVSIEKRERHKVRLENDELDTLCLQFQTARYGLDLSAASTAIYYSRTASSDAYHQSLDRIVHPEKQGPLLGIHLVTQNTVDERIKEMLLEKQVKGQGMLRRLQADLRVKWQERMV